MRGLAVMAIFTLASCGGSSDGGAAAGKASENDGDVVHRLLKKEHREMVTRFAEAVAGKDYRAAYEHMAEDYKTQAGWDDFEKSISRYRDRVSFAPAFSVSATEENPKDFQDGVIEIFVPEAMRKRVVEEAVIHFEGKDKHSDEGFWACICWIVEEKGACKILQFCQDD